MNAMVIKSACSGTVAATLSFRLRQTVLCRRNAQISIVLLCAGLLKAFYSAASVDDLRWILAPTTLLVELFSGTVFRFEHYAGYINDDRTFIIAAACAGVNFLVTAFLMLALAKLWARETRVSWSFLPAAALFAYLATIIANAVRIAVALQLRLLAPQPRWLSADQIHRIEGILVYFGFLMLVFVVAEGINGVSASQHTTNDPAQPIANNNRLGPGSRFFKRLFLPLLIYYATTLAIPLLNGASQRGGYFWKHSLFVLLIPLLVVLPVAAFSFLRQRRSPITAQGNALGIDNPKTRAKSEGVRKTSISVEAWVND
jgi:exosortase K